MRVTSHLAEQPGRIQEGQTGTTVQLARQAQAKRAARQNPERFHKAPHRRKLAGASEVEVPMYENESIVHVKIDKEDGALIKALMAAEKLKKGDIIRRAVRAYAKQLGIQPESKVA